MGDGDTQIAPLKVARFKCLPPQKLRRRNAALRHNSLISMILHKVHLSELQLVTPMASGCLPRPIPSTCTTKTILNRYLKV